MKNKTRRISRMLPAILAVMLCVTVFPVTAFAGGTDPAPEPLPETAAVLVQLLISAALLDTCPVIPPT